MGPSHRAQEHRKGREGWNTGSQCIREGFLKGAAEELLCVNPSEKVGWERKEVRALCRCAQMQSPEQRLRKGLRVRAEGS